MPYLVQYQMRYKQTTGEIVNVNISKTSSYSVSGTPVITDLISADGGLSVSVIDNEKDKFKPIRGKQATINFLSQPGLTAFTFSTGADDEWLVTAAIESSGFILFKGFLVMDDHDGKFLPVGTYTVTLTATDNLGTLKDIPLTDENGSYINGYNKIIYYISQVLRKTNLQLDIIVTDTWFEEHTTGFLPACDQIYLHGKTFEKDIHSAVDCYSVLERILKFNCTLFQYNGQWWISHVDERTQNDVYRFRFDYTGAYISQLSDVPFNQTIGKTQSIKFINADAIVKETRPYKSVQLTYNYEFPKEIVDNIDFSRGTTLYTPLDMSPVVIDGVTYYVSKYHIEDWTLSALLGSLNSVAYIKKLYYDVNKTYEKERHVVIEHASPFRDYVLESNPIPLSKNDKFIFSVDFRYNSSPSNSGAKGIAIAKIILHGDDGSTWTYGKVINGTQDQWFTGTSALVKFSSPIQVDFTQWQSVNADVTPLPVGGTINIQLMHVDGGFITRDINFSNLQFEYTPFVNGDYSKYSGVYSKITQPGNFKATIDEQVFISDSEIKLSKGAMFRKVGSAYVLTRGWFAGGDLLRQGLLTAYPPDSIYIHPFSYLQIYALFNQYNRPFRQMTGSIKGLGNNPDLNTNMAISTTTGESDNKSFVFTGIEYDYKADKARIELSETEDSVIGKDYSALLEFKFKGGNP